MKHNKKTGRCLTCSLARPCSLVWHISLLDSCQWKKCRVTVTDINDTNIFRSKRMKNEKAECTPELLGVALLYLRPFLHKLYVTIEQVKARLRVLVDVIVLVLRGRTAKTDMFIFVQMYRNTGGICWETANISQTAGSFSDSCIFYILFRLWILNETMAMIKTRGDLIFEFKTMQWDTLNIHARRPRRSNWSNPPHENTQSGVSPTDDQTESKTALRQEMKLASVKE